MTALQTAPIRVVHLVTSLDAGGLEQVVLDLVQHRDRERFDAHVLCLAEPGVQAPRFADLGVPVETIARPGASFTRRVLTLARRLRHLQPHVLHTHNPGPHLHGAVAGRLARVPVLVHTKHGRNYPDRRFLVTINRLASMATDWVVAVSDDAARVAREIERVPARKVRVVHNGIGTCRYPFRGPRPARPGLRAVTVARLDPIKDQATLLRAVRLVVDAQPSFDLDIVGDGPSRSRLEQLRAELAFTGINRTSCRIWPMPTSSCCLR